MFLRSLIKNSISVSFLLKREKDAKTVGDDYDDDD